MFTERFQYAIAEFEKFWERKNAKRPILNIVPGGGPAFRPPCSLEERWLSPEYRHDAFKHQLTTKLILQKAFRTS